MADTKPDAGMMAAIEKVAHFLETCDHADLGAFASDGVAIIENFPPYLFAGPDAVSRWAHGMCAHTRPIGKLAHRFGDVQTFSVDGDVAYLSVPTRWTGIVDGRAFAEDGGWAFVLVREQSEWRVRNYGWAVTQLAALRPATRPNTEPEVRPVPPG